jgi:hypothetical protein
LPSQKEKTNGCQKKVLLQEALFEESCAPASTKSRRRQTWWKEDRGEAQTGEAERRAQSGSRSSQEHHEARRAPGSSS